METLEAKELVRLSPEALGRYLQRLRIAQGLRQVDVAEKAGIHPTYLSFVERGHKDLRKVKPRYLVPVLTAYGLDEKVVADLVELWRERGIPRRVRVRKREGIPPVPEREENGKDEKTPFAVQVPLWGKETSIPIWHPLLEREKDVLGVVVEGDFAEPMWFAPLTVYTMTPSCM